MRSLFLRLLGLVVQGFLLGLRGDGAVHLGLHRLARGVEGIEGRRGAACGGQSSAG